MGIKFTIGELDDMSNALGTLMPQRISARASYWLSKFMKKAGDELKNYEEIRMKLIKQYGKKKEGTDELEVLNDGQVIFESTEALETFNKEIRAIRQEEVEFNISRLDISELKDAQLSPFEMMILAKLFHDGVEEEIEEVAKAAEVIPSPASSTSKSDPEVTE